MARVTVEDCVDKVPNRFELVLIAAHRARSITAGAEIHVERNNEKNPVIALREIAGERTEPTELLEDIIGSMQKRVETDEPEEDAIPLAAVSVNAPASGDSSSDESTATPETMTASEEMSPMDEEEILSAIQAMEDSANIKGTKKGGERD